MRKSVEVPATMEVWFEDLTCVVSSNNKKKVLLDNVSGRFLPGELSAILGPSGAGKTTLLNVISGYRRHTFKGHIEATKSSCYIGHEDLLAPLLSAGELMAFASRLKLPSCTSAEQRGLKVKKLIDTLGLDGCTNTRTQDLSGGEKRRLSIALELINDPPVLFLDEPTSGLDAVAASQMIKLLSKLSRGDRTIIITIHQPSASIFDLFDRVYFLVMGKCIYQGGAGEHLLQYLVMNSYVCPILHSPSDFELTEDKRNIEVLCTSSGNGTVSWFNNADHSSKVSNLKIEHTPGSLSNNNKKQSNAPFWIQFSVIFCRVLLQVWRNKVGLKLQLIHYLGCSLLIGILFFQKANDGSEFFSSLKLSLAIILFHCYTQQMMPILYYPFEVKQLKKELFNQWYSLFPYYVAYTAAKAPLMILLNLFFSTIVYSMVGLPWEAIRFIFFCAVGLITGFIAEALGLTVGSMFSPTNGSVLGPMSLALLLGLAIYGYDFMRLITPLMEFLTRISFIRWSMVTLILTIFGLQRKPLDCPQNLDACLYSNLTQVSHFLNLEQFSLSRGMWLLVINLIGYRLAFYMALKWRLRR